MVAVVEPLSSVEQCLYLTQYFPLSSETFITEEYCLTLGLFFPDILNLPSKLLLNVCFCVYVFLHKSTMMGLLLVICFCTSRTMGWLVLDLCMLIAISL